MSEKDEHIDEKLGLLEKALLRRCEDEARDEWNSFIRGVENAAQRDLRPVDIMKRAHKPPGTAYEIFCPPGEYTDEDAQKFRDAWTMLRKHFMGIRTRGMLREKVKELCDSMEF